MKSSAFGKLQLHVVDVSFHGRAMERTVRRLRLLSLQAEPESSRFQGRAPEPGQKAESGKPGQQATSRLSAFGFPLSFFYVRSVSAT